MDSEVYVLDLPWRWIFRSLLLIASYNHSHGYTAAASFYRKNIRVSSRFHQAALHTALGTKLDDMFLQKFLKSQRISFRSLSYGMLRELLIELSERYQPDVPRPPDVENLFYQLFDQWISPESEEVILVDPCLLPNQGRAGLIYQGDFLLRTKFFHIISSVNPATNEMRQQIAVRKHVLMELGKLQGRDGNPWEEAVMSHALHLHHYMHSNNSLPPTRSVSNPPYTRAEQLELIQRGVEVCALHRNGIRHSHDTKARDDPFIQLIGPYSVDNVVEHQQTDIPLFCSKMVRGIYSCGMGPYVGCCCRSRPSSLEKLAILNWAPSLLHIFSQWDLVPLR